MQQSYAEEVDAKCLECGTVFKKLAWLIINTEERPALAQAIKDNTFDQIVCTACKKLAGQLNTPLLLYQPAEKCPLYFFPSLSVSADEAEEMCITLLSVFIQRSEIDGRAIIKERGVVTVPRDMLRYIFEDAAKALIAQFTAAQGHTLTPEDSTGQKANSGKTLPVNYARIQELLGELIKAKTRTEAEMLLEGNPEFFTEDALNQLALWAASSDDPGVHRVVEAYHNLIVRCMQAGITRALLEATDLFPEETVTDFSEDLDPELQEAVSRIKARGIEVKLISHRRSQEQTVESDASNNPTPELREVLQYAFNCQSLLEWDQDVKTFNLALRAWQRVRDEADLHQYPIWVVMAWNYMSAIYISLCREFGQEDKAHAAVTACEEALKIAKEGTSEWAMSEANLALAYRIRYDTFGEIEDLNSSLQAFEKAIAATPEDGFDWDTMHGNYGLALIRRFEFSGEVSDLNRAISVIRKSLTKSHELSAAWGGRQTFLGMALVRRFEILKRREDIDAGIEALRKALEVTPEQHQDWARTNHNLAFGLFARSEQFSSLDDLNEAIKVEQVSVSSASEGTPSWAISIAHLGNAYARLFKHEADAKHLEKAIECLEKALGAVSAESPDRPLWTASLGSAHYERFELYHQENDYEAAISAFEKVISALWPDQQIGHLALTARSLGALYAIGSRWEESAETFTKAVSTIANLYRVQLLLDEREAWLARVTDLYRLAAYASARAGRLEEAVTIMEQGRARGLSTSLARDRANLQELQALDPQTYQQYLNAAIRLRQVEAAERSSGKLENADSATIYQEVLNNEARQARDEMETAIKRIRQIANYADFLAEPDFDDVIRAVTADTPLIYVVTTWLGSVFLLVHKSNSADTPASVEIIRADNFTTDDLERMAPKPDEHDQGQVLGQLESLDKLQQTLAKSLPLLGENLLANLASRLRQLGVKSVVLIPCGELGLFPLHNSQYRDGDRTIHFLDEFDVAFAPCARALHAAQLECNVREQEPELLAGVANPLPHPRPLDFANLEVQSIAANFSSSFTFYGEAATREAILSVSPSAKYVHFACHGMFDEGDPLNSSVELTNQDPLTLRQILYVNSEAFSKSRLVTLSTCQSAIHEFHRVADEVINLPSGFLQAGVPGVVGSLWPVNDISTALLMMKFYQNMFSGNGEPMRPSRALRQAQQWLREVTAGELAALFKSERQKAAASRDSSYETISSAWRRFVSISPPTTTPFSDPVYWGAFTFTGV